MQWISRNGCKTSPAYEAFSQWQWMAFVTGINDNFEPDAKRPLAGITVVELGHSVAAPYAGLILADLGARVVKVENPKSGDYARGWGPPFWQNTATAYLCLNRGKSGVTVDFTCKEDMQALKRFILDEADGVIQNLRPGILEQFELTSERLRHEKPSLIWC